MLQIATLLFSAILAVTFAPETLADRGAKLKPVSDEDFYDNGSPDPAMVELGQMLFFDKILSGNLNISCATCHHPLTDTGDGLSLPVGEGARGLGVTRDTGSGSNMVHERVPRNAPPVFNLGAREFEVMFHDGRVAVDPSEPSGFLSPAGDDLPEGLNNVLAVQAMFPVTSGTEMAGQFGENQQANAAATGILAGPGGVWELIAEKLKIIPGYVELFKAAFPAEILSVEDITYVHAANAIAAFEAKTWRFDNSPFDRMLRGDSRSMSPEAMRGMKLFYGKAKCGQCHTGTFQTDHQFHAIAMPQIGPGKGDNSDGYADGLEDFGRERVSGDRSDRFRFRTPSLRNVELTAPYGHSGAFNTLEAVVLHHLDAIKSLDNYDRSQIVMPSRPDLDDLDFVVMDDPVRRNEIADANELKRRKLKERDIEYLVAFLRSLTDPDAVDLRDDVPASVPSGLPLAD